MVSKKTLTDYCINFLKAEETKKELQNLLTPILEYFLKEIHIYLCFFLGEAKPKQVDKSISMCLWLSHRHIGIDLSTFLGGLLPRQVHKYMPMRRAHRHNSLYSSGRLAAQKRREIYADVAVAMPLGITTSTSA